MGVMGRQRWVSCANLMFEAIASVSFKNQLAVSLPSHHIILSVSITILLVNMVLLSFDFYKMRAELELLPSKLNVLGHKCSERTMGKERNRALNST